MPIRIYAYPEHTSSWYDIDQARFLGSTLRREDATVWYELSTSAISWGAAVSEEMIFRGILLPKLDYQFGKRTGLISSSLVFGLLHLFNPGIDKPLYFVSQATAAGFALGYQVQRNQYRIDKAIAAHFWYNIISMTTTWLVNPKENPLGIKVQFSL
jgi:membrane protease YdiL (CAAX protease family)